MRTRRRPPSIGACRTKLPSTDWIGNRFGLVSGGPFGPQGDAAWPHQPPGDDRVGRMEFLLTCAGAASATPRCCARWTRCRASISSRRPFVDAAYADHALPIACGQTISQPYVVAYMTEQLEVRPQHRVLEVGTGSGYQAAVLSRLAREVVTVERYRTLAEAARGRLRDARLSTMSRSGVGDGLAGVPDAGALSTASSSPPPRRTIPRGADSTSLAKAASWCCRSVRTPVRSSSSG